MFYSMRSGIWAKTGPHAFAARVEYKTSLVGSVWFVGLLEPGHKSKPGHRRPGLREPG